MSERAEGKGGVLFVVATPIGNLEDITMRALRILREVELIACEDTRRTAHLLEAHSIRKPLVSYYEHNEVRRARELVERLTQGARIALVTDAGTPGISDPGYRLVNAALEAGCRVVSVPGPSAAIAALSIAGLPTDRFAFEGFLPARAVARKKMLASLRHESRTLVFYEAARRLPEALSEMAEAFGPQRQAAIVREISKLYEETVRGPLGELVQRSERVELKGEITLVIAGAEETTEAAAFGGSVSVEELVAMGLGLKQASEVVARLEGKSRREVYQRALAASRERGGSGDDGET